MTSSKNTTAKPCNTDVKPVSDEAVLKVAKEIVVKFIEVGRLSPTNFEEAFKNIFNAVRNAARPS